MTTELLAMLGIGVAIVGLNWRMVHGLRQEMHTGFDVLRQDLGVLRQEVGALRERVIDLGERVARLEGAVDGFMGRREPSEGRTA